MKRKKKIENKFEENKKQNKTLFYKRFLDRYTLLYLIVLIFFIGLIAFGKYITGEYLFFFKDIGSDSLNQDYPAIVQKIKLMKEGFFNTWSFGNGMGAPFDNKTPVDPYTSVRFLEKQIGATIFGANYFISGRFLRVLIFSYLLTGITFFLYLRTLSVEKFSAFIGALIISFSGYIVVGGSWGFSGHVLKAVFLLFSFEQLFLKKRWYFFPLAILYLSENPFVLYIYLLFLSVYMLFRFLNENKNKISEFIKLSGKMIFFGTIGLAMNLINFSEVFIKLYNSPRVSGNASYSNILSSGEEIAKQTNLASTTILRFFSSDILGTGSNFQGWNNYLEAPLFYIGLLTLLIFPQVFIYLNKRNKIIFGGFLIFWLLSIVFPYIRYAILAFTGDYFRYGFDFFIPFTLLFFAIYSLNQLDKTFKINFKLLSITVVFLLIALFFPYSSIPQNALNTNLRSIIVLLLITYSILLFLMSKDKYKIYGQAGILLLLVFELSYFSYKSYDSRQAFTKHEFNKDKGGYADGSIKAVDYIKHSDNSFYRIEKDYQSGNAIHGSLNDAQAQGYFGTTSYSSFNQLNYVRFLEEIKLIQKGDETATRWLTGLRGYPLLQTFGNVKYHLSKSETPDFLKFGFDSIAQKQGITILKNRYYLPLGYTYDKYIDNDDFKTLFDYVITIQSLNLISQELSLLIKQEEISPIMINLKSLLNKKYKNEQIFVHDITKAIGINDTKIIRAIKKHSTQNFKNQIALLNAFIYEDNKLIDLKGFHKIDTSKINAKARMFNFKIYKNLTDSLKQDTLQITSFKQSEIIGNISLNKTKMLFLAIPYDEGWKITVNNKKEKLERVNFGFSGIVLQKGENNIELYFVPEYSKITKTISIIAILGFWLFLLFYFYKEKHNAIH